MPSFNKVVAIGNLVKDPDLKYTQSGTPVCEFSIAINRTYKDAKGEKKEDVTFLPITVFNKQAESSAEYLAKGRACLIEGSLKQDKWTSKEGEKRSRLKVIANRVIFLSAPPKNVTQPEPAEDEPAQG